MKVKGTRIVKVSDLQKNLFVRMELNQDHVLYLAGLIEHGRQMRDPIEVTDRDGTSNIIVEGRHRFEAYVVNNVTEVKVKVLEFENEAEMIAYAYKANTGGSLPPTSQDTEHTIMLLLEHGETTKRIGELLGLPAGLARKFISQVKSKVSRQKLLSAAAAVTDGGLTVARAAEQYEVDPEALKKMLSGHRRKHKMGIAEVQRGLTTSFKSLSSRNAALLRSIIVKHEEGDVTKQQVCAIFDHIEQLQGKSAYAVSERRKRFDAKNGQTAKAS